jgi:glucose-specific phosphotransferase system IIA component
MGLFDRFKKESVPDPITTHVGTDEVAAPVPGRAIALADVPDPVFAGGVLGQGLGIWPSGGVCYAPVAGTITATTATNHAVGLTTADGIEVLIHIGVDTVDMQGEGFKRFVEKDDVVAAGSPLVSFDVDTIKAAGHDEVVICVVSNTPEFASVEAVVSGEVEAGSPAIKVTRK